MQNKKDKGFTLVELLIVIVILGILATITVFAVRGITDQGQKSACNADKKTLQTAVEAHFAQYGGTAITYVDQDGSGPLTAGTAAGGFESQLVGEDLIVSASGSYDVNAGGDLVYQAAPTGSTNECIPTGSAAGDVVPA